MAGINRALTESRVLAKSNESAGRPCIFLSHISVDKRSAIEIGNYITARGDIDIYLDINDYALQMAAQANDAARVTEFIEKGLSHSSHIMCLVSANTVNSWWVPYELGFAKKAAKHLATLKLKGDASLPDFLKMSEIILGTKGLNEYLTLVRRGLQNSASFLPLTESLMKHTASPHPLDQYLDWGK